MAPEAYEEGEIPLLRLIPLANKIIGINEYTREYNLTKSQLLFMTALYYRGSLNMSGISEYISSSKEQATRTVAPLVERGLVKRVSVPKNRTLVCIELTEHGKSVMDSICDELRLELRPRLNNSLSPEEIAQLTESVRTTIALLMKVK